MSSVACSPLGAGWVELQPGDTRPERWQFRHGNGPWIEGHPSLAGEVISPGNDGMSFRGLVREVY